ncbi:polyketide biosynthesis methyltransferase [Prauserella marina]|uniref:S-adenosyl methyltransferase n=1 Tax=Prauserella marina TaxID=530584 RepID=A0A222VR48_9PSEU|nr:SAM-dependent methyltransferase [Prauserella marina]ASR36370.1 polyketide biosynthesis methyltransferase [Prauserella marina]PWV77167.1 S-adenosyl methyltransferase [Prauserella marina]SDD05948.1 S-adenosyl methyltransferase [Prauserella marina]
MSNDPAPLDLERPSAGRVYDYLLGGTNNYAIDREFAEQQIALTPWVRTFAIANRAFLGRAVRYAIENGVRQFVDLGSGLPTQGNVHEVADRIAPGEAKVVYVDNEPIAHAHSRILLEDTADPERHFAFCGDFFGGKTLWTEILEQTGLDRDKPICLLTVALLHFMPPESNPEATLAYFREQLPSGSLLVLSHASIDEEDARSKAAAGDITDNYAKKATHQAHLRTRDQISTFFGELDMVDPGLVWLSQWRPDEAVKGNPAASGALGGVARKA